MGAPGAVNIHYCAWKLLSVICKFSFIHWFILLFFLIEILSFGLRAIVYYRVWLQFEERHCTRHSFDHVYVLALKRSFCEHTLTHIQREREGEGETERERERETERKRVSFINRRSISVIGISGTDATWYRPDTTGYRPDTTGYRPESDWCRTAEAGREMHVVAVKQWSTTLESSLPGLISKVAWNATGITSGWTLFHKVV